MVMIVIICVTRIEI